MQKIYVKYKELTIGELVCQNNVYMYTTYPEGLNQAQKQGYPIMLYFLDKDFIDARLPKSLKTFLPDPNTQMWFDCKITAQDTDFNKLYKVASQDLCDQELYISINR